MRSNVVSIVQPSIDVGQLASDIKCELSAIIKDERTAQTAGESAARRRIDVGRMLAKARPMWPERGPKAKGWGEFLEKCGLAQQTAHKYMDLAGFVSLSEGETSDDVPTYRDAGIDKRPRKAELELDEDDDGTLGIDLQPAKRRRTENQKLPGRDHAPPPRHIKGKSDELVAEMLSVVQTAMAKWPRGEPLALGIKALEKELQRWRSMDELRRGPSA